ncbi:MAG: glycogen synthase GlgA [Bacteroidetes bacterium]|nr:glycogen synthase GlgA [Bacteroidota bacterium]MCL5033865.1 glycogen synthase GlgA [Bacteroidota bacterium]
MADVASSLPQALKEIGNDVRLAIPRYGFVNERKFRIHEIIRLKDIDIPIGKKNAKLNVKSSFLIGERTKVQIYFIDSSDFFGRTGIYQDPKTKKDYADNDERFIFYSRGIFEILKRLGWAPHIIHCNDWQTGLVPAYLKKIYASDPFFKNIRTVFTIHNVAYQGNFPKEMFAKTGLPADVFTQEGAEFFDKFSFMKSGLVYSDYITTVSQTYAKEISESEEYGCGMDGVLRKRKKFFTGIVNGIDYTIWNPDTDQYIPFKYSVKTLDAKVENKKYLLKRFNKKFDPQIPLIGMVSRLVEQKGMDLVIDAFPEIMKMNVQVILLGTGEKQYHTKLEALAKKYPEKFILELAYDDELSHLIEGASDIFLMPSKFEPCGLNQLYSLKYGTIPVVRRTGGLADTVKEVNPQKGAGTGFFFDEYKAEEMIKALSKALAFFGDQKNWQKIMRNAMAEDFSWTNSARQYAELYTKILDK